MSRRRYTSRYLRERGLRTRPLRATKVIGHAMAKATREIRHSLKVLWKQQGELEMLEEDKLASSLESTLSEMEDIWGELGYDVKMVLKSGL